MEEITLSAMWCAGRGRLLQLISLASLQGFLYPFVVDQSQRAERKLVAILAADVVGYSRLMGLDEMGTLAQLKALRRDLFDPLIASHRGRIVKLMGDGALIEFASVVDAVDCAVEIQRSIAKQREALAEHSRISFRIGINLGDVIIDGDDVYGDGVNVAARLEGICEPDGIVISGTTYDQAKNKVDAGFKSLGNLHLKNIADPVRAYAVLLNLPAGAQRQPSRQRFMLATMIIFLVVAAGFGLVLWPYAAALLSGHPRLAAPVGGKPTIAVLPFGSLSDNAQQDYFADGITDDLITDLSKVSGLVVIARNSAFAFKGQPENVQQAAEQLNVRYVLTGNVRRSGDRIRVNVQLVDSATASNVWAERYEGASAKIFELQDHLVHHVVEALSVRLTESETSQISRLPTRNLEAYDFYTRAEQKVYAVDRKTLADALSLYDKAISLDPEFADAYAGYARAIVDVLSFDFQPVVLSAVARQRAYEFAGRALELNPKIPRAYAVLSILQMLDGEIDRAIESVQQAVALSPNSADAKLNLAIVLTYAGRNPEALAAIEQVLQLDPKPKAQVYDYHSLVLYMNHRYEEALKALRSAGPDDLGDIGLEALAMASARLGRMADARKAVEAILKRIPSQNIASLRIVYSHHQKQEDLDHRLTALRDAGLPEWSYNIRGRAEDRLDAAAIRALAMNKIWMGHLQDGVQFIMQLSPNGDFALRAQRIMVVGKFTFEHDLFCTQSSAILLGRKFCSPVYRNPGGSAEAHSEYVYPDSTSARYFSVAQ
jgi:adenylate cyclase